MVNDVLRCEEEVLFVDGELGVFGGGIFDKDGYFFVCYVGFG